MTDKAEIKTLIRQRQTALNRLDEIFRYGKNNTADEFYATNFLSRANYADPTYEEFQSLHNSVISLISTDEEFDVQDKIRMKADQYFYAIKAFITRVKAANIAANPVIVPPTVANPANTLNARLPKIDIPRFDGNFKNWLPFFDLYKSMIHNSTTLPDIEKFQYLLTFLEGEPLRLVQRTSISDANYAIAYNSLVDYYDNTREIATAYFNEFYLAPNMFKFSQAELRNLIDVFVGSLASLKKMAFNVDDWDFPLFNILMQKLDTKTKTDFEIQYNDPALPTYKILISFLEKRCKALKIAAGTGIIPSQPSHEKPGRPNKPFSRSSTSSYLTTVKSTSAGIKCPCCNNSHSISNCSIFLSKAPSERFQIIKSNRFCINCLNPAHLVTLCASKNRCRTCKGSHHTLLHFPKSQPSQKSSTDQEINSLSASASTSNENIANITTSLVTASNISIENTTVLLSTAIVEVKDMFGGFQKVRALLDTASMANFMTEKCAQRLGLKRFASATAIEGLNYVTSNTNQGSVLCQVKPHKKEGPLFEINSIILSKICTDLPKVKIEQKSLNYLKSLTLADSKFYEPGPIDMLIGAEFFPQILLSNRISGLPNQPSAIETIFGWVLQGRAECLPVTTSLVSCCNTTDNESCASLLEKFWNIEKIPERSILSKSDIICEKHYLTTTHRLESGQFVVSLPFKIKCPNFGNTYSQALRRLTHLESRFTRNKQFHELYSQFMQEYIGKKYISPVSPEEYHSSKAFYLPHHGILKSSNTSTKLRVVFDASCKGSNGLSLNDVLYSGPKLQQSLVDILFNFRTYSVVFIGDIKQMYSRIFINKSDVNFQRFLWRFSNTDPLQEYYLNRVVFGISAAPYLALRTIKQLAEQECSKFPLAAKILSSSVYIDDCVCGADDVKSALKIQTELIEILKRGGFELGKWASNDPALISSIMPSDVQFSFDSSNESPPFIKVLGLQWSPQEDVFSYAFSPRDVTCTKRNILSQIARLFDPLGFIAPSIFLAKHLLQQLWLHKCEWDENPSKSIIEIWTKFISELPEISAIKIPRYFHLNSNLNWQVDLHGFCDASTVGYGGVIYFRFYNKEDIVAVRLIHSKSKVAPLKSLSLPRLELCAAYLLSELIEIVYNAHKERLHFENIFAWSDSQIALSWINSSPHRWNTFVANRVSIIQEKSPMKKWNHVPTALNPADPLSRGLFPHDLLTHEMWWNGPTFLYRSEEDWPNSEFIESSTEDLINSESKQIALKVLISPANFIGELLDRYSSLTKIQNILAYSLRFIGNCKKINAYSTFNLQPEESKNALKLIIKYVQAESFPNEISACKRNGQLIKPIKKLAPFLDDSNILRVGGRLRHSDLHFDVKHPILLPKSHRFTQLLIEETHKRHFHPGLKTTHNLLLQNYWILSPRNAIYRCLSKCIKCFRSNPRFTQPYMADLPSFRISEVKAFSKVAIDYAGPYKVTMGRYRGAKSSKAYVFIFVCCAVKAIHIELSSDLSSETCIAAMRRFVARRGQITDIYSDQGTNFIGAFRQLSEFSKKCAEKMQIKWHFNPPGAPHFNGLAEAGVKSTKNHLRRVVGEQILTFEEFYTLLTQIEAILNSRPLFAMSEDPNDLQPLTPNHFLNLEAPSKLPESPKDSLSVTARWQLLQRMNHDFWCRWSQEYLHTLQQRQKWLASSSDILINSLVLIKDECKSSLKWALGRVIAVHPGSDGVIRVATLKTQNGIMQRPVVKLCFLPNKN